MSKARKIAYKVLNKVDQDEAYSNLTLNQELTRSQLDDRDRRLTTELVYGVLRMRKHLDYIINEISNRPVQKMDQGVKSILRLGLYQMKFLDKIPTRAAVHTSVELAKKEFHPGIGKFVNGVLRNIGRKMDKIKFPEWKKDPVKHISTYYSHPEWLVKKWIDQYGPEETTELCKANNMVPELTIRANTLKTGVATLVDKLAEKYNYEAFLLPYPSEGILLENPGGFSETDEFKEGEFTIQGQASMLVAHALQVEPEMKVADLCAAPGGKTTHLAALMENQGDILAIDIHKHKVDLIEKNCQRLGVTNVETRCADSSQLELEEKYDRVLLDAPCSGLGLLAQKPEIRWMKKPGEIQELTRLQSQLIENGLSWLKDDGILVYSTCTLLEEENQTIINQVLEDDRYELMDLRPLIPEEDHEFFDQPYLEFLPHETGSEGFFIAAIRKRKE